MGPALRPGPTPRSSARRRRGMAALPPCHRPSLRPPHPLARGGRGGSHRGSRGALRTAVAKASHRRPSLRRRRHRAPARRGRHDGRDDDPPVRRPDRRRLHADGAQAACGHDARGRRRRRQLRCAPGQERRSDGVGRPHDDPPGPRPPPDAQRRHPRMDERRQPSAVSRAVRGRAARRPADGRGLLRGGQGRPPTLCRREQLHDRHRPRHDVQHAGLFGR